MRLGLNLGYWGARQRRATTSRSPRRPSGSATRSVWAAEAYGVRRRHRARLGRRPDRAHRRRLRGLPDPGPHAGDDRDDRRDPRHPLRRPVPARPRRLRAAGLRGLARRALRQAARPHPRVRRDRPHGAGPRDACEYDGRALDPAAARRPRQGAAPHRPPGPRRHPALPRRGRPEEPRAHRRDRRRLAGDLLRARARRRAASATSRAGPRDAPARTLAGFDVVPDRARGDRRRRRRALCRRRSRPTPRCTSAAWAAASRTSTTSWPCGWATRRQRPRCRTSTWPGGTATRPPPCRSSSSTDVAARAAGSASPTGCTAYAEAGVTTLTVAPYAASLDERVAALRTLAEALDESGLGE